jgi:hypothetical protein
MAPEDLLWMSPFAKWKKYRKFPWKFVVHVALAVVVVAQVCTPIIRKRLMAWSSNFAVAVDGFERRNLVVCGQSCIIEFLFLASNRRDHTDSTTVHGTEHADRDQCNCLECVSRLRFGCRSNIHMITRCSTTGWKLFQPRTTLYHEIKRDLLSLRL